MIKVLRSLNKRISRHFCVEITFCTVRLCTARVAHIYNTGIVYPSAKPTNSLLSPDRRKTSPKEVIQRQNY